MMMLLFSDQNKILLVVNAAFLFSFNKFWSFLLQNMFTLRRQDFSNYMINRSCLTVHFSFDWQFNCSPLRPYKVCTLDPCLVFIAKSKLSFCEPLLGSSMLAGYIFHYQKADLGRKIHTVFHLVINVSHH